MVKVTSIDQRKTDHIEINLKQDVRSTLSSGLEQYRFIHEALPEINLDAVDTSSMLFGKRITSPVFISSMTGGTEAAKSINHRLAEAAQETGIPLGVGSQRAAIDNPSLADSFSITRKAAPDCLLFANLGAIQLNYQYGIQQCQQAVDMLQANALILHLNPLQEAVQPGGDTNFAGLARKISAVCKRINIPVIVKEVGWGISETSAKILVDCGVTCIDVAGAGGTSWTQVEMHRAPDEFSRQVAGAFIGWGIPTTEAILNVKKIAPRMMIFASGGLKDGLDIAKCIALGARMGGMAAPFLKAATISTDAVINLIHLLSQQIKIAMFGVAAQSIDVLQSGKIYKIGG